MIQLLMHFSGSEECNSLGMQDGRIGGGQITSSPSASGNGYSAKFGRLHYSSGVGFIPSNYATSWMSVKLQQPAIILGVATQGRRSGGGWITSYHLKYRDNGILKTYLENNSTKVRLYH